MPDKTVLCLKEGHVARITLNRPGDGNRITGPMTEEMDSVCRDINSDNDVYVVILTGAGESFCAGIGEEETATFTGADISGMVAGIEKPVIAALNGDALGEGLELALACDIRLAPENARFGLPQVSEGTIPLNGGTQRLPRLIGKGKALEMILTAELLSAADAYDIGLVSRVVPAESLAEEAAKMAEGMAKQAPISLRYVKEAVNKGMDMTMDQGLRLEADLYLLLHTTADRTEGITAFIEKRTPEFNGE